MTLTACAGHQRNRDLDGGWLLERSMFKGLDLINASKQQRDNVLAVFDRINPQLSMNRH